METSLLIQYMIIALLAVGACYYIFRIFRKKFGTRKNDGQGSSCDSDCGCS